MIRFLEGVLCGLLLGALGWDLLQGAVMKAVNIVQEIGHAV